MVVKKYIEASLKKLDKEYNRALLASDPTLAVYASKLAVIEYCGWIEETMDAIVYGFAKGRLKTRPFQESLSAKIDNTHGFRYKKHFRPMLVHVLGAIRCEAIQRKLDRNGDLSILTAELENYVEHRNGAAHSYVNKVLPIYPSPSATIGSFQRTLPILRTLYALRKDPSCV